MISLKCQLINWSPPTKLQNCTPAYIFCYLFSQFMLMHVFVFLDLEMRLKRVKFNHLCLPSGSSDKSPSLCPLGCMPQADGLLIVSFHMYLCGLSSKYSTFGRGNLNSLLPVLLNNLRAVGSHVGQWRIVLDLEQHWIQSSIQINTLFMTTVVV